MTNGQIAAVDYIEKFVEDIDRTSFQWEDLSQAVKDSGARVKNWLTIRQVLQYFINEGHIKRDHGNTDAANGVFDVEALRVERYIAA